MKIRMFLKAVSVVMSAAMCITAVPGNISAGIQNTIETTGTGEDQQENLLKIWFDEPVSEGTVRPGMADSQGFNTTTEDNIWQQLTLPIGNSRMGATVYGELAQERLAFNQKTLWNGGPSSKRPHSMCLPQATAVHSFRPPQYRRWNDQERSSALP